MKRYQSALFFAIAALLTLGGCGDPNPCAQCPKGTQCRRTELRKGDPVWAARYECVQVIKTMVTDLTTDDGSEEPTE